MPVAIKVRPAPIAYNGAIWYVMNELKDYDPLYFHGTSQGIRRIIERKGIPADVYAFAYFVPSRGAWQECADNYNKGKLLVKQTWVEANIPSLSAPTPTPSPKETQLKEVKEPAASGYDYEAAPPVLRLSEEEMFKDAEGKPLDIEVRGERHPDRCYFRVKDVSDAFGMHKLNDTITHAGHDGYVEHADFKRFIVIQSDRNGSSRDNRKELFLTYDGILRVLFASRSKNAHAFRKWATERLFAIQMGTPEQKVKLIAELKGVSVEAVASVFNAGATDYPCVYLIAVNKVKDARASFNIPASIPDDSIVYKYGRTEDLKRRMTEHANDKTGYGSQIRMVCHAYIDPLYVSKAETDVKEVFEGLGFNLETAGHKELVVLNAKQLGTIERVFQNLSRSYCGRNAALVQQVAELKQRLELAELTHKHELAMAHKEIEMRDEKIRALNEMRALEQRLLKMYERNA